MAFHADWMVHDATLPVRTISYVAADFGSAIGRNILRLCFADHATTREVLPTLQKVDPTCGMHGHMITMSEGIGPQYLASYLLDNNLIDQACYTELQKEMDARKGFTRKPRRNGSNDNDHTR